MVPVTALWLPILLSAVLVFVASSVIHMFTPWHKGDVRGIPGEDDAMAALRRLNVAPGDYVMPYAGSMEAMRAPAYAAKLAAGPAVFMTVWRGTTSMGPQLAGWFLYSIVVSIFAGYIAPTDQVPGLEAVTLLGTSVASVVRRAAVHGIARAHQALARWAETQGFMESIEAGRWREVYLETNDNDYSDWLIAVQLELTGNDES